MTPKLIFIFSLPRSGSTWLQRIISTHPDIATTSEPWLLLPLLSPIKDKFGIQPYEHELCLIGISEALSKENNINEWKKCYLEGVRLMAYKIYSDLSCQHKFFLDKTPRYSLICEEIIETFPDAKFIFLWRHPFSIILSIYKTWSNNNWTFPNYYIDLYEGFSNMINVSQRYKDKVLNMQYEKLATHPEQSITELLSYLGLEYNVTALINNGLNKRVQGRMGDPNQYRSDGGVANHDWQKAGIEFCTSKFRRVWLINYLNFIGRERLDSIGYDITKSKQLITHMKIKNLGLHEYYQELLFKTKRAIFLKLYANTYKTKSPFLCTMK